MRITFPRYFSFSFKKKKGKIEGATFSIRERDDSGTRVSRSGEINRGGCIESRRPGARERRRNSTSGFRQAAGRVVCRLAALSYASATGLSMNAPTRDLLEIDSLSFPLSLSLSTGCARSFNSCTPPENRFHECKSPSEVNESERRAVHKHSRDSMRSISYPLREKDRNNWIRPRPLDGFSYLPGFCNFMGEGEGNEKLGTVEFIFSRSLSLVCRNFS